MKNDMQYYAIIVGGMMKKIAGAVLGVLLLTGCSYREVIHNKNASLPETLSIRVVYDGKTKVNGLWFDDPPATAASIVASEETSEVHSQSNGDSALKANGELPSKEKKREDTYKNRTQKFDATGDMNNPPSRSAVDLKEIPDPPDAHSQNNGQPSQKEGIEPPFQENKLVEKSKNNKQTDDKTTETAADRKYLADKSKRQYYEKIFDKIQVNIEKILPHYFNKNNLNTQVVHYISGTSNTKMVIEIKIKEYVEGEFNLITNKNTEMIYDVNVLDENKKVIANFRKKYIVKTNLELPLEYLRLSKIDDQFSADLSDFLAKVFNREVPTGETDDFIKNK